MRHASTTAKTFGALFLLCYSITNNKNSCHYYVQALSSSSSSGSDASVTRSRVMESLASPSGKLTISPEIVIPDPSEPTAILLQADAIKTMSGRVRNSKANTAWISGSLTAIQSFCSEQESARGSFPGPLPVIYCNAANTATAAGESSLLSPEALAEAGVSGIVVPLLGGKELESVDQISSASSDHNDWVTACQTALDCGIQPIPEVVLGDAMAAQM